MDIRHRRALRLDVGSAVTAVLLFLFSPAHAVNQPPKVALAMKSFTNESFLTMENGTHKHQRDYASEYSLLANGIRDRADIVGQIRPVEQMIAACVDTLVLAPADFKALVSVVRKAVDMDTLVINIDNGPDPAALKEKELNVSSVRPDSRKGVRLVGDFVAKSFKPGDAVDIIEGIPTTTNAQRRTTGFKDTTGATKLKTAGVQSGEWEVDKEDKVAVVTLCPEPDLRALLCGNDSIAIGAVPAVRVADKLGRVSIGSYDNIDVIKVMLADGRVVATADQHTDQQAVYSTGAALKALTSRTPQAKLSGVAETLVSLVTRS